MIGYLEGRVIFSDGQETLLYTASGIGYQVYCSHILPEGQQAGLFISHIVKETDEELYGFDTLKHKKMFETLLGVKGVGPKSAYSLLKALGPEEVHRAIVLDNKKTLQQAPGIGAKAAAQIILDLRDRINKMNIYSENYKALKEEAGPVPQGPMSCMQGSEDHLLQEALMACKELGFNEKEILPLARKILEENQISRPEQLVHLVLKGV